MIIECKNLTKAYLSDGKKIKAVDNIDLAINKGDFVVILGHSGSGKTTLLSLIGGLTRQDQGDIKIKDVSHNQLSDQQLSEFRNSTIGFIFQFASLITTLTVSENMLLPLTFGADKQTRVAKVNELLLQVGLQDKANVFPSQLSGGEQRRVAIARAFVNDPDIILADEPTGDLDEETENEILNLFKHYNHNGTTFMVVTHNKKLCESQVNPRILNMKNGDVLEGKF